MKSVHARIRPVNKVSISEEIVQQIIELISSGHLKPGQRLPSERDLCKNFGASRSSLREALRCLSIVGVLNARVGEGTTVAANGEKFLERIVGWRMLTEKNDIENLMEVRIGLEGAAAASVARDGTEADIAEIEEILAKMKGSLNDQKRFAGFDLDFHTALAKASGNPMLLDLISLIRNQLARGVHRVLATPHAVPRSFNEHIEIVQAIKRRDRDGARRAMQVHLDNAVDRYHAMIEKQAGGRATQKKKTG
jgi:GntR family transcriptional regulator, transcriptional repressor for pyruvate dehydrogenase complex